MKNTLNTNININLIKIQFLKKTHTKAKIDYDRKIKMYDFFSINEIKICEIIKKIPYYYNNYNILIQCDFLNAGKVYDNSRIIEKINMTNNNLNQKYLLFQYKISDNDNVHIELDEYLFTLHTPKLFISSILNLFPYLLDKLLQLNNKNICFFNLCPENILISQKEGFKLILQNFETSLLVKNLNETYISQILERINNYTYKPLEVHVLFYLIKNDDLQVTNEMVEEICTNFINDMDILSFFSQKYKESYKIACIDSLQKYIHMSKTKIIEEILEYNYTWDNYSLSILFLHIIGNIIRVFSLKNTFMNDFLFLLLKNISPNPLKRETFENTKKKFDELFYKYTSWSFINDLSLEKMNKLHEYISK